MLAGPKPRIYSFVSAISEHDKNAVLVNLSASLARVGSNVLMLDACVMSRGVLTQLDAAPALGTLLHAARGECTVGESIARTQQGFGVVLLSRTRVRTRRQQDEQTRMLDQVFPAFSKQADIVLIDAELDDEDGLPITAMSENEIVILVSPDAASIKEGYALIKRLIERFGRRPFGVLVTGASEARAQVVFRNMAQAARRYLAVTLHAVGSVPADEHLSRAARLGRAVVEAFPLAGASVAFRHLAGRIADLPLSAAANA